MDGVLGSLPGLAVGGDSVGIFAAAKIAHLSRDKTAPKMGHPVCGYSVRSGHPSAGLVGRSDVGYPSPGLFGSGSSCDLD
jgi:hypothetical protein